MRPLFEKVRCQSKEYSSGPPAFDPCCGSLIPDVMHDVLEGVLQYETKLLLRYCVLTKKFFTLATLNVEIEGADFLKQKGWLKCAHLCVCVCVHAVGESYYKLLHPCYFDSF